MVLVELPEQQDLKVQVVQVELPEIQDLKVLVVLVELPEHTGPQGPSGPSGNTGPQGPSGATGDHRGIQGLKVQVVQVELQEIQGLRVQVEPQGLKVQVVQAEPPGQQGLKVQVELPEIPGQQGLKVQVVQVEPPEQQDLKVQVVQAEPPGQQDLKVQVVQVVQVELLEIQGLRVQVELLDQPEPPDLRVQVAHTGATGPQGPSGGLSQYAYVYNEGAQTVAIEADVTFDTNGVMTPGITHAPGTSSIIVTTPGDYLITFSVSGVEPNQFALFVNGVQAVGTVYGSGAGTQQNNGQAIITLASGDVITLRNHSSASAVILQTLAGGTQTNVNASIALEKLN